MTENICFKYWKSDSLHNLMEEVTNILLFFQTVTNLSATVWGYLEDAEAEYVSKQIRLSVRYQYQRN